MLLDATNHCELSLVQIKSFFDSVQIWLLHLFFNLGCNTETFGDALLFWLIAFPQFSLSVSPLLSLRHARCVTVAELCQFSASDLNSPTGPVWQLWRSRSETKHKTLAEMDLAALPDSLPAQGSRETKPWAIRFRKMILRFDWCTDA